MQALLPSKDKPEEYQNLFSLKNRIAIVTGAAGHLGSSISKGLVAAGAQVVLIGRTEKKLMDFKKKYQANFGNKFEYFVCDVTNSRKFKKIVKEVDKKYGKLDILVNNAYHVQNEDFGELTKGNWNHAIENNLTQYFKCTQEVSQIMLKNKKGSIINIASIYGFLGVDQRIFLDLRNNSPVHYAVAKGGILQMTRYLSTLWAKKGVRVNSISPGYFPKMKPNVPERPDYIEEICKRTPMQRIGQPDEISGATVFLASDASSFITGQNLIIDGGWSIW